MPYSAGPVTYYDLIFLLPQHITITVSFVKWHIVQQILPCLSSDVNINALQTMWHLRIPQSTIVNRVIQNHYFKYNWLCHKNCYSLHKTLWPGINPDWLQRCTHLHLEMTPTPLLILVAVFLSLMDEVTTSKTRNNKHEHCIKYLNGWQHSMICRH